MTPAPPMTVIHHFRTLWRFHGFRQLLTVRLLSQSADGIFQVGLATYVVFAPEQETTPGAIAAAMAVLLLPYSLLGPFAGVLLDRWRRRQVLLYGNLLRTVLTALTCTLVIAGSPSWLFYLCALSVTAVNRFVLAGLSASLPHVVDGPRLMMANSLSPTAGTVAATVGGSVAFAFQVLAQVEGPAEDAVALVLASVVYLLAGAAALRIGRDRLGPAAHERTRNIPAALAETVRGLLAGLRHVRERRPAAYTLAGVALMRYCYGALLVMLLMLARHDWDDDGDGMALLGLAVGLSGAGFFVAAVLTPWATERLGRLGWFVACATSAALLVPVLGMSFHPLPMLVAALLLGLVTQGPKIVTDTVVQSSVADEYRGRAFALYDMLFNVAFVSAAGTAALILPPDGRSLTMLIGVSVIYALTAWLIAGFRRTTGELDHPSTDFPEAGVPVSRET